MKILIILSTVLLLATLVPGQEKLKHAVDLYRNGNYGESVKELEDVNLSGAGNYQSYLYLGAANVHLNKEKEAREAFAKANKLSLIVGIDGETSIKVKKKKAPSSRDVPLNVANSGRTQLATEFKADGTIGFTFLVQTTTVEFVRSCLEVVKQIKFDPATSNGSPVSVVRLVEFTFER